MQETNVGHGKTKINKMERITLRSTFEVLVQSASRSWCGGNVDV
jgi:hypothetical protein